MSMSSLIESLLEQDETEARKIIHEEINKGHSANEIINRELLPALQSIGEQWSCGDVALAQIYTSGKLCEKLLDELLEETSIEINEEKEELALVLLEDYHVMGKRIVQSFLRSSGYRVIDYGRMDADELITRVIEDKPKTLLISVLMINSARRVGYIREKLDAQGVDVRMIVGGAPFNLDKELWSVVGADATAPDAGALLKLLEA